MKYVALIPARGGSKRLPRKNILPLAGKPLLVHSIEYVQKEHPDIPVYVSTDDAEVKEIALRYGAKVIDRPAEYAADTSTTGDVMKHTAEWLTEHGVDFDYIIITQATQPLRPSGLLQRCINAIEENKPRTLMTVNPIIRKQGRIVDNKFVPVNYYFGQRSQTMEKWYHEDGLFCITRKDICLKAKCMTEDVYPLVTDHIFAEIDIDTLEDFQMAEYFLEKYSK